MPALRPSLVESLTESEYLTAELRMCVDSHGCMSQVFCHTSLPLGIAAHYARGPLGAGKPLDESLAPVLADMFQDAQRRRSVSRAEERRRGEEQLQQDPDARQLIVNPLQHDAAGADGSVAAHDQQDAGAGSNSAGNAVNAGHQTHQHADVGAGADGSGDHADPGSAAGRTGHVGNRLGGSSGGAHDNDVADGSGGSGSQAVQQGTAKDVGNYGPGVGSGGGDGSSGGRKGRGGENHPGRTAADQAGHSAADSQQDAAQQPGGDARHASDADIGHAGVAPNAEDAAGPSGGPVHDPAHGDPDSGAGHSADHAHTHAAVNDTNAGSAQGQHDAHAGSGDSAGTTDLGGEDFSDLPPPTKRQRM